jgi:hypothetical protein
MQELSSYNVNDHKHETEVVCTPKKNKERFTKDSKCQDHKQPSPVKAAGTPREDKEPSSDSDWDEFLLDMNSPNFAGAPRHGMAKDYSAGSCDDDWHFA